MLLSELLKAIDYISITGKTNLEIGYLAYDSRQAGSGCLFVAIEGFQTDGHIYIDGAVDSGASAIVVEKDVEVPPGVTVVKVSDARKTLALMADKFYGHPAKNMTMVGVTGTNGKTTTTHLVAAIWKRAGVKPGIIGTISNYIGDKIFPVNNTTPESLDLQKLLSDMVSEGVRGVAMEVSSHALSLNRVAGVDFDLAIFTNITQDHLDFHGNMENYLAAKAKLFQTDIRNAVINGDDPASAELIRVCRGKVYTYAIDSDADVIARILKSPLGGWALQY
ncbi:hypothetical protein N752_09110 [Desulforamulus aquiferis]|nr:hypothetical protein N752_09110 [Desulforamulus aquiferis]